MELNNPPESQRKTKMLWFEVCKSSFENTTHFKKR